MNQKDTATILGVKSTNPKDFQGFKKVPYHLFPMTALAIGAIQFLDGGCKYGRENYRQEGVKASIYFDATMRHLTEWFHGQERTPDTRLRHLGGALASIAILIDAQVNGKLINDRAYTNRFQELVGELNKETIRIPKQYADRKPIHYSALSRESKRGNKAQRKNEKNKKAARKGRLHNGRKQDTKRSRKK